MATVPPPDPSPDFGPGSEPSVQPSPAPPEVSPTGPDYDQPAPDVQPNGIPGDPGQQEAG